MESTQPIAARVKTEAELLAAIDSGKKGLIVLERDLTMSTNQNIVLQDGQSLVGARYLDKSAAQTKLNFNFVGEDNSGVEVANNTLISDLEINVKTDTKSINFIDHCPGSVLINHKIGVRISNLTINNNVADGAQGDYYVGISATGAISQYELSGVVNINNVSPPAASNEYVQGIMNFSIDENDRASFTMRGDSILNIKIQGESRGVDHGTINLFDNAKINIKGVGAKVNGIGQAAINATDGSQINMNLSGVDSKGIAFREHNFSGAFRLNIEVSGLNSSSFFTNSTNMFIHLNSDQVLLNTNGAFKGNPNLTSVSGATIVTTSGYFVAQTPINNAIIISDGTIPPANFVLQAGKLPPVLPDIDAEMTKTTAPVKRDDKSFEKANQFNQIFYQYDSLIKDSSYKGVNLLQSQNLKVVFNEDRSSFLDVAGVNASTTGLGLSVADWNSTAGVQNSLNELDGAINQLRQYASGFGNYYQIVTTREDFTNSLINVLTEGADNLTLADMNQESANMLALQTRQQLAVNSLSLASQATQSVLKLF